MKDYGSLDLVFGRGELKVVDEVVSGGGNSVDKYVKSVKYLVGWLLVLLLVEVLVIKLGKYFDYKLVVKLYL